MNWRRPRSWKHSVEGESINHADNSVCRSQPEALIIHTYTQNQGGSLRAMLATKHPSSPKGSPHSSHWLMHTHAYIHTHTCACVLGDDLFRTCHATSTRARGRWRETIWVEWGENKSHYLPASLSERSEQWVREKCVCVGGGGMKKCTSDMGKVVEQSKSREERRMCNSENSENIREKPEA